MSRRGGRGGGKRGPDLSWEDVQEVPSGQATPTEKKKPTPRFPKRTFNVPRPISTNELAGVKSYLSFRDAVHKGPYYSVLQSSNLTDDKGKVHKRAGFDPFNDQEKYTAKYQRKKQTVPDLSTRQHLLHTFPQELWSTLDPQRKDPLWATVENAALLDAPRKNLKRRREALPEDDDDGRNPAGSDNEDGNDTDASDPLLSGSRRPRNSTKAAKERRDDPTTKKAREKSGLDAEDDYPDDEGRDNDDLDEERDGEDEPMDSEFEESDDGGGDDYNAEQYFDTGENDDDDFGGGGDDDGGTY
ncbi:hypothetical protein LTR84_000439 [Exophiala bonariae]|uniref:DNA-directed RNA polymerase III subunit n=1 Tax=Exophiala bonariae TaxID=1690606 RepID=A0AAV9NUJ7_9EURO|nr:hypothetical protein LTR84_000439 [Exophiala bonariae]